MTKSLDDGRVGRHTLCGVQPGSGQVAGTETTDLGVVEGLHDELVELVEAIAFAPRHLALSTSKGVRLSRVCSAREVGGELQQLGFVEVRRVRCPGAKQPGIGDQVGDAVGVLDSAEPSGEIDGDLRRIAVDLAREIESRAQQAPGRRRGRSHRSVDR